MGYPEINSSDADEDLRKLRAILTADPKVEEFVTKRISAFIDSGKIGYCQNKPAA